MCSVLIVNPTYVCFQTEMLDVYMYNWQAFTMPRQHQDGGLASRYWMMMTWA